MAHRIVLSSVLLACVCLGGACAQAPIPAQAYFAHAGGGAEFRELGPVVGTATGYCSSRQGVLGAAVQNALEKSIAMGGNAVFLPGAIGPGGMQSGVRCRLGLSIFFLIPGALGESVQAVAIRVSERALSTNEVQEMVATGRLVLAF